MPTCPSCGKYVKIGERRCPHCFLEADFAEIAEEQKRQREERYPSKDTQRQTTDEEELLARSRAVSVVTLQYMPGHDVTHVMGIITAEITLGMDPSSEPDPTIPDPPAVSDSTLQAKWRVAKDAALDELRLHACRLGCNAVLGTEITVATVNGMPMIIVSGTGVIVAPAWG